MKQILIALLIISLQSRAQDCATQAANKPSESVRFQDYTNIPPGDPKVFINKTRINPQLNKAETWIKSILKNFKGAKLAYSNDLFFDYTDGFTEDFYKATRIKGCYSSKMRFYAYYCYEGQNKIYTEDESGSNITVYFNNTFFGSLCSQVGVFTINGKAAFELFEKSHTEGRKDFYEQLAPSNIYDTIYNSKNEWIIIRNSDKPLFLPVTRKEYLQQLLKDVEAYKSREIAGAKADYTPASEAANKARLDAELKRVDNSKSYTAEQMAPYRKRLIEGWETEKQKYDKRMSRIEKETNEARQVLIDYQSKPEEWLGRTFKHFYGYSTYSGKGMKEYLEGLDKFSDEKNVVTRTYVGILNPDYYNSSLTADVPQVIMIVLQKGRYPHMKNLATLIHAPGALNPIEALLK